MGPIRTKSMKRYSQGMEQDIILAHFGASQGTYLDAGSNDGITLSNTYALSLLGWKGVCVEPSPTAFDRLKTLYFGNPNIETHNVAMGSSNGMTILYDSGQHLGNGDHGLLSTVNETELARWRSTNTAFLPTSVQMIDFQELMDRTMFKKFDFISMDIEGSELEVLEQMDLTELGCKLICIEVNDRDITPYVAHCKKHGMELMKQRTPENIFCRK